MTGVLAPPATTPPAPSDLVPQAPPLPDVTTPVAQAVEKAAPAPANPAGPAPAHPGPPVAAAGGAPGGAPGTATPAVTAPGNRRLGAVHHARRQIRAASTGGGVARAARAGATSSPASVSHAPRGALTQARAGAAPRRSVLPRVAVAPERVAGIAGASRPSALAAALAPFEAGPQAGGAGLFAWLSALAAGAMVIALLFLDALGFGPRHNYLRSRDGRAWKLRR